MSLVSVVVALCLMGGAGVFAAMVDRIVAIVNDDVITESDVTSRVNSLLEQGETAPSNDAQSVEMHEVVLRRLIEQQLMLQEANKTGIAVASDEVVKRLDQFRGRFGTEEEFQQSLVDSRLSEQQLKEKIREQLMVQRLVDAKVRAQIVVSPQDVAQELVAHPELVKPGDRVRAAHLLVRVGDTRSEAKARELISGLHQRLLNGADFAELATRYSEDDRRQEGGAMGWMAQGELLPELDAVLFRLKAGDVSEPIQTRLGFHLVKVEERRSAESLSMMEANRAVYQQLYQQRFQDAFIRWITELKRKAYIEVTSTS